MSSRPGIDSETVLTSYVDADFFALMDVPVIQGRGFGTTDTAEAPRVAVVNQELADRFWPDRSPVGQRFRANGAEGQWVEIVGVVPTGRYFSDLGAAAALPVSAVRAGSAERE